MAHTQALLLAFVVVAAGCGANVEGGAGNVSVASAPDVGIYESDLGQVQSAVSWYRGQMGSIVDSASCHAAASQYDARVRPIVTALVAGAGRMDDAWGGTNGHEGRADFSCVAAAMSAELDHHRDIGCARDPTADRAEVMRHTEGMSYYSGHLLERCDEMGTAGSGMHPLPTMPGCTGWPGSGGPDWWHGGSCDAGMMGCCEGGWMDCDGDTNGCHNGGGAGCCDHGNGGGCCGMMGCD